MSDARLYTDLVPWYHLLDPHEDHAEEAAAYGAALAKPRSGQAVTLLDLGSGAGHNAVHLKDRFQCTLVDLSADMLGLSRALNPQCEHVEGDMRTVRLGRQFDAVLVHDAIMYMTTEADLRAALETAFVHTRPGGVAVVAPDCFKETFEESTELYERSVDERAMRCLCWVWDPDPGDSTFVSDYSFLLRQGTEMQAIHDRHVEGLFSRQTWMRLFAEVGFEVETMQRPIDEDEWDEVFVCHRPG